MTDVLSNKGIIDATQDAVLNAASSVASVLENTAAEMGAHHNEPFYLSAEFWVAMAFVLAVGSLIRPVSKMLVKMLRKRSQKIEQRIAEVNKLKEEAQKLLADYERKFRGAKKEAASILAKSEREIEMIKKDTLARLEAEMALKEKEAKDRLKAAEDNAAKEIADKTADMTLAIVRKILADSLDDKALSLLIDASIDDLQKIA